MADAVIPGAIGIADAGVSPPPRGADALPPAGLRLRAAPGVRCARGGKILLGGSPLRIVRLSAHGAQLLARWLAGHPLGGEEEERLLARRLLDAGLVDPCPPLVDPCPRLVGDPRLSDPDPRLAPPGAGELTVVIPVYGDAERLAACLRSLGARCPAIVVDDGSPLAAPIAAVAAQFGARYVRHATNRGPAAARNTGLRLCGTPFIAFLDADCVATPGFPQGLLGHFADPLVALVAPRVRSAAAGGRLAAYEQRRSPLDMGARPAVVHPHGRVAFLPTAALLARRCALGAGFDERLRVGEDVDLAWRLHDAGWRARLEPRITVLHADRTDPWAWYRRRVQYHRAVVPLLERHPGRLPALHLSAPAALAWAIALARGPLPLPALAAARAARLRCLLAGRLERPAGSAVQLAARATAREGAELTRAMLGPWAPFALAALGLCARFGHPAPARRLAALVGASLIAGYLHDRTGPHDSQRSPAARPAQQDGLGRQLRGGAAPGLAPAADGARLDRLGPLSYCALRAAEESARGLGIWLACLRARDVRALAPAPPPGRRSRRSGA
jgi:mycofactocin system glycosyltransferase